MSLFAQQGAKKDTGFPESVLQRIWDKYNAYGGEPNTFGGRLPVPQRAAWKVQAYFYCYFIWIHKAPDPDWKQAWRLPKLGDSFSMCRSTFYNRVLPIGDALAAIINEVEYGRRLNPFNHAPFFKYFVTGIVDVLPIYVPTPSDFQLARFLYQPKCLAHAPRLPSTPMTQPR